MTLEKTLRAIVIGGIFLLPFVPLIVVQSLFFPYITGKNFAFRIIVEVVAGAWLALALVRFEFRPRRSWILGALLAFTVVIGIADVFGENPFKSIWSNYERMDGWVTLAHLLVYTIVAASVLHTENLWRRLFQTSLIVSVYVAIYGFLQVAGISALGQGGIAGLSARVDATFGNPIYLAVYLLFHIGIAAHLWVQSWAEREKGARLAISLLYGSVIILNTLVLFLTGTRGTIIGLIGGTFLAALILALSSRAPRTARRVAIGALVAVVLTAGSFWLARDAAWVQKVGVLHRLATISTSDNTVKARFINWSIAWQGVKERPLLGWGQENYAIVFDKYYDPRMYAQEPWFDRVHNIIFDWLVAGGIIGLVSYLAIFAAALSTLWRSSAFTIFERSIFTGLLAAYFCHNVFVFDNVTSYILFGTILAYFVFRSTRDAPVIPVSDPLRRSALPYAAFACALLVWGTAWFVNADALSANRMLLKALSPHQDLSVNLDLFRQAIQYGSLGTQEAREQLVQAATQLAPAAGIATSTKIQFFETSVNEMMAQAERVPLDARFPLFVGIVHDAYGDYENGARVFMRARDLSPRKQSIYFELGRNAFVRGKNAEALQYFKTAYDFVPEYTDARLLYAAAAIRAGEDALADQLLNPLIKEGGAADQRILASYVIRGRYDKAISIWEARVAAAPKDMQAYFTLAALYFESGNPAKAIGVLERAKTAEPQIAAQADSFIEQIRNGTAETR